MFIGVQVPVEGEELMVRAIDKCSFSPISYDFSKRNSGSFPMPYSSVSPLFSDFIFVAARFSTDVGI